MKVNKFLLERMNRKTIIEIIRTLGPINQAQIARTLGLSIPTVMKHTDDLVANGLVKGIGKGESSGGKRPELYKFESDAHFIVGVDVGRKSMKAIVSNLNGRIVYKKSVPTGSHPEPAETINRLTALIQKTIESSLVPRKRIIGMGIGMPGLLDVESGRVVFSPDFHWEDVDLLTAIKNKFKFPIYLENSNRAQAMGEKWFGSGVDSDYFVSVNLGYGIGSAIIERGELYRGSCGNSGEVGHITLEKDGPVCECGKIGCLEALASGNAIARQAQQIVANNKKSLMYELANKDMNAIDAKIVFDAAKQGDETAATLVHNAVEYIGIGLANYINILDPDKIILGGGMTNAGDILIDGIKQVMQARQMKHTGGNVKIVVAKLGADGTAIGAASLVLKSFIECGGDPKFL